MHKEKQPYLFGIMLQKVKSTQDIELNQFAEDSVAFFKGNGLPGHWTYSSPNPNTKDDKVNGAGIFTRFIKVPEYYLRRNEEAEIPKLKSGILRLSNYYNLLADMGCGDAFSSKVATLLANTDADYAPIDINQSFLDNATGGCNRRFPEKVVHPRLADFMEDDIRFPDHIPFPIMLGCTITNFGTTDSVRQIFRQAKIIAEQGNGSFFFTHDTNRNPLSLRKTYLHELMKQHTLNVLHRMKRDLPTENFYPEHFMCDGDWHENKDTFLIYMSPARDMTFSIAGEEVSLSQGEILPQAPLMKLSSDHMLHLAQLEGWQDNPTQYDSDRNIAFQHLHL